LIAIAKCSDLDKLCLILGCFVIESGPLRLLRLTYTLVYLHYKEQYCSILILFSALLDGFTLIRLDMDLIKLDMDLIRFDMDLIRLDMNLMKLDIDLIKPDIDLSKFNMCWKWLGFL
jgi:hypothetical protein